MCSRLHQAIPHHSKILTSFSRRQSSEMWANHKSQLFAGFHIFKKTQLVLPGPIGRLDFPFSFLRRCSPATAFKKYHSVLPLQSLALTIANVPFMGLMKIRVFCNGTVTVSRWTVSDLRLLECGIARRNSQRPRSACLSAKGKERGIQIGSLMESQREVPDYNVSTPGSNDLFFQP